MYKLTQLARIEMAERLIKSLVKDLELNPQDLLTAVHNASVHGEIYPNINWGKDDIYLKAMFNGFDISIAAARTAEKEEIISDEVESNELNDLDFLDDIHMTAVLTEKEKNRIIMLRNHLLKSLKK